MKPAGTVCNRLVKIRELFETSKKREISLTAGYSATFLGHALHHGVRGRAFQEMCAVLLCYVRMRVLMLTSASVKATAWLF